MRARAVIGTGHGDEGKGLVVDHLASLSPGAVVARTNGGAQAGHTVVTPDGRRHVFHHLGAGALAGASTHLTRFFVSNPMLLARERDAVAALGGDVRVTADPRGAVTTPWDVAANQAAEIARGDARHGSCGIGFGETVGRDLLPDFRLHVGDLARPWLEGRLRAVRDLWFRERLRELGTGAHVLGEQAATAVMGDRVLARFARDCRAFAASVDVLPDAALGRGAPVILEGAQGLLLDQDRGVFPYVTRSNTGLRNMASVAREAGIRDLDVVYVTRAYATRHGAGPLAHEGPVPFDVVDPTNEPNPWQGIIRHAPLDLDVMARAVAADLRDAEGVRVVPTLAITCLDQACGPVPFVQDGRMTTTFIQAVPTTFGRAVGVEPGPSSWGPTRTTVRDGHVHNLLAA